MGKKQTATSKVQELRPLLDGLAKNLADRLYGPDGLPWDTPLSELEDTAVALRTLLAERLLHHALARQAEADRRPAAYQVCPTCRGPLEVREPEPRLIGTRAGEAQWSEPHLYCTSCRRAFFPSVGEPGAGPHRL